MYCKIDHLLYAAGAGIRNTIRTGITLTEQVDGNVLRETVNIIVSRFPYFLVSLERHGEDLYYVPNNSPIVIRSDGRPAKLNSAESNFHLISFSYKDNTLFIDTSHFLTDGMGKFPLVKLLLYTYLCITHPEEMFDATGISLPGEHIPVEEATYDPYPDMPLATMNLGTIKRPERVFKIEDQQQGYDHMHEWTSYFLRIPQKEMMSYASMIDGSPASFISSVLFQAISDQNPDNHLPIVCGMQHQFRKALGNFRSHSSHVNIVPIVYPASVKEKNLHFLNTLGRGAVLLGSDVENDKLIVNRHIKNSRLIKNMTLDQKCRFIRDEVKNGIGENTFEVSYVGRVIWGGLDKYIKRFSPVIDITLSGGLSVEIFSLGEFFEVNIMQRKDDERYVKRFIEILSKENIECFEDPKEHFEIPGFEL